MSNKKSRKLLNIMLSAMMILGFAEMEVFGAFSQQQSYMQDDDLGLNDDERSTGGGGGGGGGGSRKTSTATTTATQTLTTDPRTDVGIIDLPPITTLTKTTTGTGTITKTGIITSTPTSTSTATRTATTTATRTATTTSTATATRTATTTSTATATRTATTTSTATATRTATTTATRTATTTSTPTATRTSTSTGTRTGTGTTPTRTDTSTGTGTTANSMYGINGIAYVLLSSDFATPGVYRLNEYDGSVSASPWKIFKTNDISKASGLAANQRKEVFLFSSTSGTGEFTDAEPGWLPTGVKFDDDSPVYLKAVGPNAQDLTDYKYSSYGSHVHGSSYWKTNYSINGTTYKYAVVFGGPAGVRYLNCVSGTSGTPIWDGTFKPESTTNSAAIKHPTDSTKIILPSHFGALAYYLYGTKNGVAEYQGKAMDGTNGRPLKTYLDGSIYGNWYEGITRTTVRNYTDPMFTCVVKRVYQKRNNSLDLYTGKDATLTSNHPQPTTMTKTTSGVLATVDVKVKEYYGKYCGDDCIPGGLNGGDPIEGALSTVTVVTTTTGNRYGYNPLGKTRGADSTDAALRVVTPTGTTQTISTSTDNNGQSFDSSNITNSSYLSGTGITPISMKTIGVSSNFTSASAKDYIYGSGADHFVVQDNWWGKGGIAYEYYRGDDTNPGNVRKLDYVNTSYPTVENLGDLSGKVDAIGIDGNGYFYALRTEEQPSNNAMAGIYVTANENYPSVSGSVSQTNGIPAYTPSITLSGWKRDTTTTSGSETSNAGTIDVAEGSQQVGDYKIATLKQAVYKTLKRYPEGSGSLGTEEDRGYLFAGYDTWTNHLKKTSSGVTWAFSQWQEEEGTRVSDIPAELAVVNVAASPIAIEGTDLHYITITGGTTDTGSAMLTTAGGAFSQTIGEQDSLTFKVEGYKPYVGGSQRDLKNIGKIQEVCGDADICLNTIPAEDGSYAHDENHDGLKSGFPSSMFEAGSTYATTVSWQIAQVEDTTPVSLNAAKRVTDITPVTGSGPYKSLTYQFKQPGRYIIQATVTYNYFSNFGTAERPSNLQISQRTFTTEPMLISVVANDLKLNQTPSYITNISMTTTKPSELVHDEDTADLTCVEDGKFSGLHIAFDAQFYRESNANSTGNLDTFDGIGVWDYNYYDKLYTTAKSSISGISVLGNGTTGSTRAYNKKAGNLSANSLSDVANSYKQDVYNPGKTKSVEDAGCSANAGTLVNGRPTAKDLSYIQWALYLRPITPNGEPSTSPTSASYLIAKGTCGSDTVTLTDLSDRKYHISFDVPETDCKINTPRDPKDYVLDLAIIYPRVTWLNNDLGANMGNGSKLYSSVVPYTAAGGAAPVHIISKIDITASSDIVNVSDSVAGGGESLFNNGGDSVTLCVRDKEKPVFKHNPDEAIPFIETTGEKSGSADFLFQIVDNNPYLATRQISKASAARLTTTSAVDAAYLATQDLINNTFVNDDTNKKFYRNSASTVCNSVTTSNEEKTFYSDPNWNITLDYKIHLNKLSPDRFAPSESGDSITDIPEKGTLSMENWVGSLSYSIVGQVYDGIGDNNSKDLHYIYNPKVYRDLGINSGVNVAASINSSDTVYLNRLDNDPPSIDVELISQSDNRRWVFKLIEGINDPEGKPASASELKNSTLIVKCLQLKNANNTDEEISVAPGPFDTKSNIPGTTAVNRPSDCNDTVKVTDYLPNAVPSIKRAGRILVNVGIFDNCGFQDLQSASIAITDSCSGNKTPLAETPIDTTASHEMNGSLKADFATKPRGSFVADMPMKVDASQPQIMITVKAKDLQGNERILQIPVKITESSFETRVLETKENRQ